MSEMRFDTVAREVELAARKRMSQLERKRSSERVAEEQRRQSFTAARQRSRIALERAVQHAQEVQAQCTEREQAWAERQSDCTQRRYSVEAMKILDKITCLAEHQARGRPEQPKWQRKDIRLEEDPKLTQVLVNKRAHETRGYLVALDEDEKRREREEIAKIHRLQKWKTEIDKNLQRSLQYEERKEQAHKIKEDFFVLKESILKESASQKDLLYQRNKEAVRQLQDRRIEDRRARRSSKSFEAESRRKSIETAKKKQQEYLHSIFEERVAKLLQHKADFDNSKKEYFRRKVAEHDKSIVEKRIQAELFKVVLVDLETKDRRARKHLAAERSQPAAVYRGKKPGHEKPQNAVPANQVAGADCRRLLQIDGPA
jgi:hypothetical protein